MNNYYHNNSFPGTLYNGNNIQNNRETNQYQTESTFDIPIEQSYVENTLRTNKGKMIKVYMTFPNSTDKEFDGILEWVGINHLVISEPSTGKWDLLPISYIDFITFEEKINTNSSR